MIVSLVKGGLGNMMFQIAAGASLANKIGTDFGYSYENWHCCTQYKIDHYPSTIFSKINQIESLEQINLVGVYQEPSMLYSTLPPIDNLLLDGYFQTEKYFDTETVKNLFDIPKNEEYKGYTFLHIRRGDYIKYQNIHNLLSEDYYENALDIIKPKNVVVLTDDVEWAKSHELFKNFKISNSKTDIEDLSIMVSCESAIIANSTFSWWGAWLMDSDKVVCPKKWHVDNRENEIICQNWISIET
jgi:hypothetical protein